MPQPRQDSSILGVAPSFDGAVIAGPFKCEGAPDEGRPRLSPRVGRFEIGGVAARVDVWDERQWAALPAGERPGGEARPMEGGGYFRVVVGPEANEGGRD